MSGVSSCEERHAAVQGSCDGDEARLPRDVS